MSKLIRKISLINPNDTERKHAEILVYPDGANLSIRDEYQYHIFGICLGSETSAKRYLSAHFGKGWKVKSEIIYDYTVRPYKQTYKTYDVHFN